MTTNTHILWRTTKRQPQIDAPCPETMDPGTETLTPLRGANKSRIVEKCLPKKSLLKLVGNHRSEVISCLNGLLWITQPGNPEDILVHTGESFAITHKGTILIEGLAPTRLKISASA